MCILCSLHYWIVIMLKEKILIWLMAAFCAVYRQASNINMLKEGMTIEATHVRKKQLHQYLPAELVHRGKKKVVTFTENGQTIQKKLYFVKNFYLFV